MDKKFYKKKNLRGEDLRDSNLERADLRDADLRGADLRDANIDYSCWPLWCGTQNVIIDERQARQLLAHAFNAALIFFPGGLTEDQKKWLNEFHRIKSGEFCRF